MLAPGVVAQELVESHIPPMGPGIVIDSDGFPFAAIGRPGSLFPDHVIVSDVFRTHSIGQFTPPQTLLPQLWMGAAEAFYSPTVSLSGPGYTFDSTTAVSVTLSNNNLTATHSSNANNSGVKGVSFLVVGKYYYEVTIGTTNGNSDTIGIATPTATYAQVATSATVVNLNTGAIGTFGKSLGAINPGAIIGIATDITGQKAWFQKNGGSWNNDPTADPATGVGGITIPSNNSWAPVIGFAGGGRQAGDNATANFGATLYQTAAPSGFVNWPTGVVLIASKVPDVDLFYTASTVNLTQVLTAGRFEDEDVFAAAARTTQALSASRAGIGSSVAFNLFARTQSVTGIGIATFPPSSVATILRQLVLQVLPARHVDTDTIAAVAVGVVTPLSPSLVIDSDSFLAPTISSSVQATATLWVDSDSFAAPTVTVDTFVAAGLFVDADAILASAIGASAANQPALFVDTESFYVPTAVATATLAPALFSDSDVFFVPDVRIPLKSRTLSAGRAGLGSTVVLDQYSGKTQVITNAGAVT